jgi:hypothetical protein
MIATDHQASTSQVQSAEPAHAGGGLADASIREAPAVLATGVVPALVRGLFSPRRRAIKLLTAINADGRAVSVLTGLRRKYDGQGMRLLGGRMIVLWGASAMQEVLDHSAELYGSDAGAKAKGMSHFQPDALTLSRRAAWRDRRTFNEAVLASRDRVHRSADRFVAVVADEVGRMRIDGTLQWRDWERLFEHITLRVIFGDRAREEQRLTSLLEKLMAESNRLVGLSPSDDYYELYGALERQLRDPEPGSLLARIADAPHGDR